MVATLLWLFVVWISSFSLLNLNIPTHITVELAERIPDYLGFVVCYQRLMSMASSDKNTTGIRAFLLKRMTTPGQTLICFVELVLP